MTKDVTRAADTDLAVTYQGTAEERAGVAAHAERRKQRFPAPRLKVIPDGETSTISADHPVTAIGNALVLESLATADNDFFDGLLSQLINASAPGRKADERSLNIMLAMVRAVAPKDEVEAMLAAQMAAVHAATMATARRLAHIENTVQQDSASNALNKLARTFATQMEALKRYRTGGEQRVVVQHVTVSDGGQAIVGAVSPARGTGGSGNGEAAP